MEITSTKSNVYSAVSISTNKINNDSNDNTTSNLFESFINKVKITNTKTSDYYESSNIPSTSSVTYEKLASVKWEDQFINPHLRTNYDTEGDAIREKSKELYPESYEWYTQIKNATNGNKYEDAPEFEAFVNKWMDKGYSENEALGRAAMYARAGLLDYGKQKMIPISNLPYGDIKQHGMHLINNEPLKKAMIETLNSLNGGDASNLIASIFQNYPENANTPISFQELLKNFGVKLEDLKKLNPEEHKNDKFTFTGDINLKNGADSKEYNNFIFDTLVKFFKDRIERFDEYVKNTPPGITNNLDALKDSTNSLIDNLKNEVDSYNSGFLEKTEIDK
jgi:hypothetical protein